MGLTMGAVNSILYFLIFLSPPAEDCVCSKSIDLLFTEHNPIEEVVTVSV